MLWRFLITVYNRMMDLDRSKMSAHLEDQYFDKVGNYCIIKMSYV